MTKPYVTADQTELIVPMERQPIGDVVKMSMMFTNASWWEDTYTGARIDPPLAIGDLVDVREEWRVGAYRPEQGDGCWGDDEYSRSHVVTYKPYRLAVDFRSTIGEKSEWITLPYAWDSFPYLGREQNESDLSLARVMRESSGELEAHGKTYIVGESPCRWRPATEIYDWLPVRSHKRVTEIEAKKIEREEVDIDSRSVYVWHEWVWVFKLEDHNG